MTNNYNSIPLVIHNNNLKTKLLLIPSPSKGNYFINYFYNHSILSLLYLSF
nr:MAG TPA: hypothetical protein [Caudoviricetes sp.]